MDPTLPTTTPSSTNVNIIHKRLKHAFIPDNPNDPFKNKDLPQDDRILLEDIHTLFYEIAATSMDLRDAKNVVETLFEINNKEHRYEWHWSFPPEFHFSGDNLMRLIEMGMRLRRFDGHDVHTEATTDPNNGLARYYIRIHILTQTAPTRVKIQDTRFLRREVETVYLPQNGTIGLEPGGTVVHRVSGGTKFSTDGSDHPGKRKRLDDWK
jgi:hypothetical protein